MPSWRSLDRRWLKAVNRAAVTESTTSIYHGAQKARVRRPTVLHDQTLPSWLQTLLNGREIVDAATSEHSQTQSVDPWDHVPFDRCSLNPFTHLRDFDFSSVGSCVFLIGCAGLQVREDRRSQSASFDHRSFVREAGMERSSISMADGTPDCKTRSRVMDMRRAM